MRPWRSPGSSESGDGLLGASRDEIVIRLQVDPELRSRAESLGKKPGSLRGDPSLAPDQLVDALNGCPDVSRKGHLSYAQRFEELFK